MFLTVLETPHVIVGAAIATKVVHPALAIPLAFASHFMLEKVPHWNPHLNTETEEFGHPTKQSTAIVILDASTAFITGGLIAFRALPNTALALTILASCLAASLPDLVEGPYFFLNIRNKLIKRWVKLQKSIQVDTDVIPGLLTQALVIAACLWWIFAT
jgi:hypothetical protein